MKDHIKQAVFVLAVIAIAKVAQQALNISQTSGIGVYLP